MSLPFTFSDLRVKVVAMRDGDGDGLCNEGWGKRPIPCPPGVPSGSRLTVVNDRPVFDFAPGGGIDRQSRRRPRWLPPPPKKKLRKGDPVPAEPKPPKLAPGELSPEFRYRMAERMAQLGLTRKMLADRTRAALKLATPEMREAAKRWYEHVHERTGELTDAINARRARNVAEIGFEQTAAVIAALSPAREFGKNVNDAKQLLKVHAEDELFSISEEAIAKARKMKEGLKDDKLAKAEDKIRRLDALLERINTKSVRPSDFTQDELDLLVGLHPTLSGLGNTTGLVNVIRAMDVLRENNSIDDAISGPKMRSFFSNIVNPDGDRVTIDTWMYRVMTPPNKRFTITGDKKGTRTGTLAEHEEGIVASNGVKAKLRTQDLFQSAPSGGGVPDNVGLYPVFADVVREVADEEGLPPAALQAILWEVGRTQIAGYDPTDFRGVDNAFNIDYTGDIYAARKAEKKAEKAALKRAETAGRRAEAAQQRAAAKEAAKAAAAAAKAAAKKPSAA